MANQAKTRLSRKRCILILSATVVVVILAIAIPVAVVVSRNARKGPYKDSKVILPLYIYPRTNSTWDPLYTAVQNNPRLKFVVIINPSSGPGSASKPDENYANELQKLNKFSNIQKLGYVRTGYASRNVSEVLADIATYGTWPSQGAEYAMDGIFLDESPHVFAEDADRFMRRVTSTCKSTAGLQGDRLVVRNPGVVPAAKYEDANTDVSIIFEEAYPVFQTLKSNLSAAASKSSACGLMVHSVPSISNSQRKDLVHDLVHRCNYVFYTTNSANYYESWGSSWQSFVDGIARS